jgi:hypothetical protein
VAVRGYTQRAGPDKQLLDLTRCQQRIRLSNRMNAYHYLVSNAIASWEKRNAMRLRKCFDLLILFEIRLSLVLDVMIECATRAQSQQLPEQK